MKRLSILVLTIMLLICLCWTIWGSDRMSSLTQAHAETSIPPKINIPKEKLAIPTDMQACGENLKKIHAALKQYEKDKGQLPNWLSELVPDYLDHETLFCPEDTEHTSLYSSDPKLPCSYGWHFSDKPIQSAWDPTGKTRYREFKTEQIKVFGNIVPMVRCYHHGSNRILNLSAGGDLWWGELTWEYNFRPDYASIHPQVLARAAASRSAVDVTTSQSPGPSRTDEGLQMDDTHASTLTLTPVHNIMGSMVSYYRPMRIMLSDQPKEALRREPTYSTKNPLYGAMDLGDGADRFVTVVVDEPEGGPARIYIDRNNDEDLTNDGDGAWTSSSASNLRLSNVKIDIDYSTGPMPYTFSLYRFTTRLRDQVLYYRDSARQGEMESGGQTYKIAIMDDNADGRFDDLDNGTLLVDLNQDGTLVGRSDSPEQLKLTEPFNVHGTVWSIDRISPDGSQVTLKPSTTRVAMQTYLEPGYPAPTFSAQDLEGKAIELSQAAESAKYILLDFWASWCGPCRTEFPYLRRLHAEYRDRGLCILGINMDSARDAAQKAAQENGLDYRHVFDGLGWKNAVAVQYRVTSIPQTYLLDKDLNIVAKNLRGASLERKIAELLGPAKGQAGRAVASDSRAPTPPRPASRVQVDRSYLTQVVSIPEDKRAEVWAAYDRIDHGTIMKAKTAALSFSESRKSLQMVSAGWNTTIDRAPHREEDQPCSHIWIDQL
jgi:thiol-disulfide isomerase/thioredoxin